ncbi:hypothetical protein QWY75_03410 [Pontixanthobacter aestiaquae]|uniref:VanZ like family protein n=1 Tax=Pontixanthobacter aestiaquae TaxID=1509367 RepID=A0A844Z766_9SPHN|nr:hypothetical protein [Pontixanthobacter aestiaquae]MDN3645253.1 hypothetical protein [Pontixanthobacter aestiaquae]MXO83745.1 hypothetical protein [Pontixanthobacter aestiaquae]
MSPLNDLKNFIVDFSGLAKDALHVYVALIIFLGACLIFRWKASEWKPLGLILAVAVVAELIDIRDTLLIEKRVFLGGNWHDIWNTMLAPVLLFLMARFTVVFEKRELVLPDEIESGDEPEV